MNRSKVICSYQNFKKIDVETKLYKIIVEFYDLVIDKDEELISNKAIAEDGSFNIDVLSKVNGDLRKLYKREYAKTTVESGEFKRIEKKEYHYFLNDILILPDTVNVSEIRAKYGILALHINDDILEKMDYHFAYSFNKKRENTYKTWERLFEAEKIKPVNSAILIDNYLWSYEKYINNNNEDNLFPILKSIIPKTLAVPFYLLIIIQNSKSDNIIKHKEEFVETMVESIKESFKNIDIKVGIITQIDKEIFHRRLIITNHHLIYSDKGFTVFMRNNDSNELLVFNNTVGTRNWVFKDIENYINQIDKHEQLYWIEEVLKLIEENKGLLKLTIKGEGEREGTEKFFKKNITIKEDGLYNVGYLDSPLFNKRESLCSNDNLFSS